MAAAFLAMIPMVYLSGLIFPIENMPPAIQLVTYAHPAALLRRDHPRRLPARLGHRRAVARGGRPPRHGRRDPGRGLAALPEEAGLAPRPIAERARSRRPRWRPSPAPDRRRPARVLYCRACATSRRPVPPAPSPCSSRRPCSSRARPGPSRSPASPARSRRRRPPRRRPRRRSRPRRRPTRPAPPPAPSSSSPPARATSRARRAISSCRRARRRAARSWPGGSAPSSSATSTSTSTRSRRSRRAASRTACPRGWTRSATCPTGAAGRTRSSSSARATPPAPTGPSRARPCPASTAGTTRCPTGGSATGCRSTSSATGRPTSCGGSGWPFPALLVLALVLGRVLGAFTTAFLHRLFRRTPTEWDERLLKRTSPALTLLWAVAVAAVLLPWLALLPEAHRSVRSLLGGAATIAVFWALWRSVDVWAQFLMERPWAADNPSARSLLSVTRNLAKVFVADRAAWWPPSPPSATRWPRSSPASASAASPSPSARRRRSRTSSARSPSPPTSPSAWATS